LGLDLLDSLIELVLEGRDGCVLLPSPFADLDPELLLFRSSEFVDLSYEADRSF